VQILEPKIPALASTKGRVAGIVLKLVLGYVLIGETGGIESRNWPVLLLPVVTAATLLGLAGTLVFIVLAAGAYLSFLAWLANSQAWQNYLAEPLVRVVFVAMGGILAYALAEDLRIQTRRYRQTAEQLAEANAQLRQAEEAVRRSERLAALGQLSAAWRTSCATPWEPSRLRPRYWRAR